MVELEDAEGVFELCIGSDYLSPGYLEDEEATAKAFFVEEASRYYRTGDLVSIHQDQCIAFVGRKVWHEKVSGKRVNLLEVEHALHTIGFPADTVVMAAGEDERRRLYVFSALTADKLPPLRPLRQILPDYMLPKKVFLLEDLPKLPNEKVDRMALMKKLEAETAFTPLSTDAADTEVQALEKMWKNSLELPAEFDVYASFDSYKELGGNSQGQIRLVNQINHYFKTKHQLELFLEPVALDQYLSFSEFKNHVLRTSYLLSLDKNKIRNEAIVRMPELSEIPIERFELIDAVTGQNLGQHPKGVLYDFVALEQIVKAVNKKHGISIRLADSHQGMLDIMQEAMNAEEDHSQIGLLLLKMDTPEAHLTPAVLCIDRVNQKQTLLISEGIELELLFIWFSPGGLLLKIRQAFNQIGLGFEFTNRQRDKISCSTDGILYLIEALQLDMMHSIQINGDSESFFKTNHGLENAFYFIGPPETYKTSMTSIPAEVPQDLPLKGDEENRTLETFIKAHQQILSASLLQEDWRYSKYETMPVNTYLWEQGYYFKGIVDKIIEDTKQNLFTFEIQYYDDADSIFNSLFCSSQYKIPLYIKKNFFHEESSFFDFEQCIASVLPANMKLRKLIIEDEIVGDMQSINQRLKTESTPVVIQVISQKRLDDEPNLLDRFISQFKQDYKGLDFSFFSTEQKQPNLIENLSTITLKFLVLMALEGNKTVLETMKKLSWVDRKNQFTENPCIQLALCLALKDFKALHPSQLSKR